MFTFSHWIVLGDVFPPVQGQMVTKFLGRFAGVAAVGLCAALRLCCELPLSERAAPVRVASSAGHARVEEVAPCCMTSCPALRG
ncbi:MAG: hypothetical protein NZ523_11285 [Elioraea sp.]|nr:hypothetical protein [Elioraea sp.]